MVPLSSVSDREGVAGSWLAPDWLKGQGRVGLFFLQSARVRAEIGEGLRGLAARRPPRHRSVMLQALVGWGLEGAL